MNATSKLVGLAAAAAVAVSAFGAAAPAATSSLYQRLGGEPVVTAFVSETIDATAADPRLNQSYRNTDIKRIKRLVVEQICDLAGGGCHYGGDSMQEVHANHHITQAQFFGLVENLRRAMRRHHVNLRARNELLALLAPMAPDVINVVTPPPPNNPSS